MKTLKNDLNIALLVVVSLFAGSCEDLWDKCVDGNGDRGIETRALEPFERVEISGSFEVQIDTGNSSSVVIEGDENLIDLIVTHVSGNRLVIETRDGICINPTRPIEITVSTGTLNDVTLNGSGLVYCYGLETLDLTLHLAGSGQMEFDNLEATLTDIDLSGSGLISCNLLSESVSANLEGSGEIKLRGECISSTHKIIGSGKIKAQQLLTGACDAYISGSGIIDAYVTEVLDVTIIGSGIVYYTGNPIVESYISGSGEVIER